MENDVSYSFIELNNIEPFDPLSITPKSLFTQSDFYRKWQEFFDRKVRRFVVRNGEIVISYFQIVKYPLAFGKSYLYIPYGPVTTDLSGRFLSELKNYLKNIAKEEKAVFTRLDFVPAIKENHQKSFLRKFFIKAPTFTYHSAYFQPRREWYIDLAKSEKDLYESMEHNHRYSVRLSERKEIKVEIVETKFDKYLDEFYNLMEITSKRNGFGLHPKKYYETIFKNLDNSYAFLTIARFGDKILAMDLIIRYGDIANYVFACTSNEERNRAPAYGAIWSAIKHSKALGAKYFNFGGISTDDMPNKSWNGLTSFKKKFGGFEIHHSDFYDLVTDWPLYILYLLRKFFKSF